MNKINITLAKSSNPNNDELLAEKLLPSKIEELYIEFTNALLSYDDITKKQEENARMLTNNSLSMLHISEELKKSGKEESAEKDKIRTRGIHLKIKRIILNKTASEYKKDKEELLELMRQTILKINNGYSIYDLESYSDDSIVSAYINLRKNCYRIIESIGTFILKKQALDPRDKIVFEIATTSLQLFDFQQVQSNAIQVEDIKDLMNLISEYLTNRKINYQKLSSLNDRLVNTRYTTLMQHLNEIYKKEVHPYSLN